MNISECQAWKFQDNEEDLTSTAASEQLMWLHRLHTAVDLVLRNVKATKVDITGKDWGVICICEL